jgi:ankyrin repeat protein
MRSRRMVVIPCSSRQQLQAYPYHVRYLAAVFAALLAVGCMQRRTEAVGGSWVTVWLTSPFPEAVTSFPHLHRSGVFWTTLVAEFAWHTEYLGDDCVLFTTGSQRKKELFAGCGDLEPLAVAPTFKSTYPDPPLPQHRELAPGFEVSLKEIKRRASLQPPRKGDWLTHPSRRTTIESAIAGDVEDIRALAATGVNRPDVDGYTPLFWAVLWKKADLVQALIEAGAVVNARDKDGETALFHAFRLIDWDGSDSVAERLLAAGADSTIRNVAGVSALETAVESRVTDDLFARFLKQASEKERPLVVARRRRAVATRKLVALNDNRATPEAVSALLKEGADPNGSGSDEETPLSTASKRKSDDTARILLSAGADPKAVDRGGGTALTSAAWAGNTAAVRTLLAAGADPNAKEKSGETAVYWATLYGRNPECLKVLLEAGGDPRRAMNDAPGVPSGLTLLQRVRDHSPPLPPDLVRVVEEAYEPPLPAPKPTPRATSGS